MMSLWRTVLALSRPVWLPTVWSNCLAGWWLGGGGDWGRLTLLLAGASLLYLGGVFLNDAFDADYDIQERRARPIPSGAVTQETIWRWGLGWIAAGFVVLLCAGPVTGGLALGLIVFVLLYNAVHRVLVFSPVLLGICRFFLYMAGASVAIQGVTGWSIWGGLALGCYATGVTYFAQWRRRPRLAHYGPVWLLAVPILLALLMDTGPAREKGLLLCLVLVLWTLRSLRTAFWSAERNLGRTFAGLTAGIVLVDWLAVADATRALSAVFIGLFLATLAAQRLVPTD